MNSSVYASESTGDGSKLHMVIINKNLDEAIDASFDIASEIDYESGRVWAFDQSSSDIHEIAPISGISGNSFSYSIPPLSACHLVLEAGAL